MKLPSLADPYIGYVKMALFAVAGLALFGLVASWYLRGQKIDRLETWQQEVQTATAVSAGVKSVKPNAVVGTIQALGFSLQSANSALDKITADSNAAKARSDAADAALRAELAVQRQRFQAASRRIDALDHRTAAGTSDGAAAQIEDDSKAAWQGWTQ